jgi:hypothetical protein
VRRTGEELGIEMFEWCGSYGLMRYSFKMI